MSIERVAPLITVEQLTELVNLAVSSKTNELELAVAEAIKAISTPPMIYTGDVKEEDFTSWRANETIHIKS